MAHKIHIKAVSILLLLAFHSSSKAQDISYARSVINILCSDSLYGRGYVSEGDRRAAAYIAREFEKTGLKKFGHTYEQHFPLSVNTLPGELTIKLNNTTLQPGADYLVDPGSPSLSGTFKTVILTAAEMLNDQWIKKVKASAGRFIILEPYQKDNFSVDDIKTLNDVTAFLKYSNDHPAAGTIVLTHDKLTWSSSIVQYSKPSITVLASVITQPIREVELDIEAQFLSDYQTQNIVGYIEGTNRDSLIVLTAHYDHLGMMGRNTIFPGANDNASGVAMLLHLAKHFASTTPPYSLVFIAFSGEESGLLGSSYFTEHPLFDLKQIRFLINFDISGTGDDGIQVVNGKIYKDEFDRLTTINNELTLLSQIKVRGEACNSDHCMFYRKGVPSFFIYTLGGIQAYHDIFDRPETLPLTEFADYAKLITTFIEGFR